MSAESEVVGEIMASGGPTDNEAALLREISRLSARLARVAALPDHWEIDAVDDRTELDKLHGDVIAELLMGNLLTEDGAHDLLSDFQGAVEAALRADLADRIEALILPASTARGYGIVDGLWRAVRLVRGEKGNVDG